MVSLYQNNQSRRSDLLCHAGYVPSGEVLKKCVKIKIYLKCLHAIVLNQWSIKAIKLSVSCSQDYWSLCWIKDVHVYVSLVKIAGTDSGMCWKIILDFIKFTHLSWLYSEEFVDLVWVDRCSDIFEAEFHDLFSKKNITNFGFKNFKALTFLKKFMEWLGRRWIYSQNRDSWFWAGYCH